ncbi:hypothetical protein MRB53_021193 [Persea americana]|uniref:Uncharacterized protein n=1 Tax=Persea americana TaxID=3435 RepID=A0ACC2L3C1_PERAE|nr:hypothetical protein MRB53_021193 [Persea americana]
MAGKGKRERSEEKIEDVQLSSLPDCLLHRILSFLDMKDVIRTSILSKRWRDLSTSVPNLNFNKCSTSVPNLDFNICSAEQRNPSEVGFLRFVERALFANSASKIHKFRLCFSRYDEKHDSHLDACIRFVMNKGVRELDLDFTVRELDLDFPTVDDRSIGYKLPCLLLNCETLTSLKLRSCRFTAPDIARFTKLTALSLSCIPFTTFYLDDLLQGCPLLEDLVLVGARVILGSMNSLPSLQLKRLTMKATRYSSIVIEAPNLQILKISCGSLYKSSFKDMPFLKEAYLDLSYYSLAPITFRMGPPSCLDLPFQGLCDARVLRLSSACIQVMPIPTFKDLHFNFKTKLLILRTGVQKYEMLGIANLLWSSPYLENLIIDLVPSKCIYVDKDCELKYDFDEREYWESLTATFPCLLHHLKTIKITGFMGGGSLDSSMEVTSFQEKDEQIKLVKFFLKNAMVLEKMIIHVSNRPKFVEGGQWLEILLGVTKKLVAFPRASSRAEVIFSYK